MAEKCANCGSPNTYALAHSNGCYDCDVQTATGEVEADENTEIVGEAPEVDGGVPRPDIGPGTDGSEIQPDPEPTEDTTEWVSVEARDRLVREGAIAPRDLSVADQKKWATKAKKKAS